MAQVWPLFSSTVCWVPLAVVPGLPPCPERDRIACIVESRGVACSYSPVT